MTFSSAILLHSDWSCLCYRSQSWIKERYLDTLVSHNYDKELFLLVFLSVAFSLIMIMLQANSSSIVVFCQKSEIKLKVKEMGKVNNSGGF